MSTRKLDWIVGLGLVAAATGTMLGLAAERTASGAPTPWPRYKATISKDRVNLRVEPSLKGRMAPSKAPKGTELSVQRAADPHWLEILEPDEYRGFFLREDMISLGAQE